MPTVPPRELLRFRRIVRRSSELAGLPPLPPQEEELRAQTILLERQQQGKTVKVDLDAPVFETRSGTFEGKILVSIREVPGAQIRYSIERLDGGAAPSEKVTIRSPLYRRSFMLDKPGTYHVQAIAVKDAGLVIQRSLVSSSRFVVAPGASGTRLRDLPSQMIQGALSIAKSTDLFLTSSLSSVRAAIAQASNAVESAVHLHVVKGKGQQSTINFSVEVENGRSAASISRNLTDASLVASVAEVLKVDASRVSVEARAKQLEEVLLSLSWTFPQSRYAVAKEPDYLDGTCLIYAETKLLDVVDYRGAQSLQREKCSSASGWSAGKGNEAAVLHSGDVMSENGGQHALRVRLSRLPPEATDCIFTLSAYNCQDLSQFVAPSMRIFDADCPAHLLSDYSVADAGKSSAVVVCSLTRNGCVWSVRAHARTGDGTVRDYRPIEAAIAPIQARYDKARRRLPFVLLYRLWQDQRALPCGTDGIEEDLLLPLFDLSPELFCDIIKFL